MIVMPVMIIMLYILFECVFSDYVSVLLSINCSQRYTSIIVSNKLLADAIGLTCSSVLLKGQACFIHSKDSVPSFTDNMNVFASGLLICCAV